MRYVYQHRLPERLDAYQVSGDMCFVASQDIDLFYACDTNHTQNHCLSLPAAYFVAPVDLHVHTMSDLTAVGNTAVCIRRKFGWST